MINDFLNIFQMLKAAKVFNGFVAGQTIKISDGSEVFVKVAAPERLNFKAGFRFSPHSFVAEARINNTTIAKGFGHSRIEIAAYVKAISESVERVVFRHQKNLSKGTQTTNGWAAHSHPARACSKAISELIERDAVLVHWLKKTSMMELDPRSFPLWLRQWIENELLLNEGFNRLRVLISSEGLLPTVTLLLVNEEGHAIVAHSTEEKFESGIEKALSEVCQIGNFLSEPNENQKNDLLSPEDHARFYAFEASIPEWLFGELRSFSDLKRSWSQKYCSFQKHYKKIEFKRIVTSPLTIGYAHSDSLQDLYFGETQAAITKNLINFDRLNVEIAAVNFLPHCIP